MYVTNNQHSHQQQLNQQLILLSCLISASCLQAAGLQVYSTGGDCSVFRNKVTLKERLYFSNLP